VINGWYRLDIWIWIKISWTYMWNANSNGLKIEHDVISPSPLNANYFFPWEGGSRFEFVLGHILINKIFIYRRFRLVWWTCLERKMWL